MIYQLHNLLESWFLYNIKEKTYEMIIQAKVIVRLVSSEVIDH